MTEPLGNLTFEVVLGDKDVSLTRLCLDPNNPRYADLNVTKTIPEHRVHEESVQDKALQRMMDDRFEVDQLKESIQSVGFLRMDRMVVIALGETGKYMVVEGNRRFAALKSLYAEQLGGEVDLRPEVLESIKKMPTLVIKSDDPKTRDDFARTLQGIRHISGMKPWGPYQQAQAVGRMIGEGVDMLGIKSVLGLSTQRANLLRRVFFSMEQMKEDPEFEEFVTPNHFSHFVEAQKQPNVRDWLGWDENAGVFSDQDKRREFYRWIVGMEDDEGNRLPAKVIDAKDFRLLPKVMEEESVFERFRSEPALSLQDASKLIVSIEPEPHIDWRKILKRDVATLKTGVPAMEIAQARDEDLALLKSLKNTCDSLIDQIQVLKEHAA